MSDVVETLTDDLLHVLDGIDLRGGHVNVPDEELLANIRSSIRLGFPQIKAQEVQAHRVLLVGGGPSLQDTTDELIDLYFQGARVFTVNGAYHWCIQHHIRPAAQIVVDARSGNAQFLQPSVPNCRYLVASQCHPTTWQVVQDGREHVWIWHAIDQEGSFKEVLDTFYGGARRWQGVAGGTTVAMRALALLHTMGYRRFDLFGIDSCWHGSQHHAYAQPQNNHDAAIPFTVWPTGQQDRAKTFTIAPWHAKQLEDFLQLIKIAGQHFLLNIHGDGLLAYALHEAAADLSYEPIQAVSGA